MIESLFVVAAIDFEVPASKGLLGLTQKVLILLGQSFMNSLHHSAFNLVFSGDFSIALQSEHWLTPKLLPLEVVPLLLRSVSYLFTANSRSWKFLSEIRKHPLSARDLDFEAPWVPVGQSAPNRNSQIHSKCVFCLSF